MNLAGTMKRNDHAETGRSVNRPAACFLWRSQPRMIGVFRMVQFGCSRRRQEAGLGSSGPPQPPHIGGYARWRWFDGRELGGFVPRHFNAGIAGAA